MAGFAIGCAHRRGEVSARRRDVFALGAAQDRKSAEWTVPPRGIAARLAFKAATWCTSSIRDFQRGCTVDEVLS